MNEGWIKLHRKILDSPIFRNEKGFKVWMWCLLRANHKGTCCLLGFQKVTLEPGQFVYGRDEAAKELRMKPSTVRNWIEYLKQDSMIDITTTSKYSVISVRNWSRYQEVDSKEDSRWTADGQQMDTDKNVKNDKNEKNTEEEAAPPEKRLSRLALSRGQVIAIQREFPGVTPLEVKEQAEKCSNYMAMSSGEYKNPGLFFRGWMKKFAADKRQKQALEKRQAEAIAVPNISEDQRQKNLERLAEMRSKFQIKGVSSQ